MAAFLDLVRLLVIEVSRVLALDLDQSLIDNLQILLVTLIHCNNLIKKFMDLQELFDLVANIVAGVV